MLLSVALIFIVGLTLGAIFQKLKLPSLLGFLISGIILGPHALNLIDTSILSISADLRQIALIIILARAGLSLNMGDLKKVGRPALLMCFVPACFEIIGMVLLAPKLLGISVLEAAIAGSVIAAVSPAVVVPKMLRLMEEGYGTKNSIPQLIMIGASVDDVFVIVLFTAFTNLALGGSISALSFALIPLSIVSGLIIGAVSGILVTWLLDRFQVRNSIKVIILLCMAFILVSGEKMVGGAIPFSGLLAVMGMGAVILNKNQSLSTMLSRKLSKLWIAAEIVLFVLVGATVDIGYAITAGGAALLLIGCVLGFRMVGVLICLLKTELTKKERIFCMIAYCPKATVQAAIGSLPLAMGLSCGSIVLTVAVLAILITAPLGAIGIDASYKKLLKRE